MPEKLSSNRSSEPHGASSGRPLLIGLVTAVVATTFAFFAGWPDPTGGAANAAAGDVLVANSVCEAHELRAQKEEDPSLEIEIPAEYDKQYTRKLQAEQKAFQTDISAQISTTSG